MGKRDEEVKGRLTSHSMTWAPEEVHPVVFDGEVTMMADAAVARPSEATRVEKSMVSKVFLGVAVCDWGDEYGVCMSEIIRLMKKVKRNEGELCTFYIYPAFLLIGFAAMRFMIHKRAPQIRAGVTAE